MLVAGCVTHSTAPAYYGAGDDTDERMFNLEQSQRAEQLRPAIDASSLGRLIR
jgi:hypothetical protein